MNKEEKFVESRIIELANKAYAKDIYTYSDFLNLNEQNILNNIVSKLPPIDISLVGGNVYAERKIAVFSPKEVFYDPSPPISMIKISPLNAKYSDTLSHRDFLGAIMNLGIERTKIGDILIRENEAYVYVIDTMSEFIRDNLIKIKHTSVMCVIIPFQELEISPEFKEITGTVSSLRLDAVISLVFGLSRANATKYISEAKVFVNGKLITSNGYHLKEKDIVSLRGLGRFIYNKVISETKKGRYFISVSKYV